MIGFLIWAYQTLKPQSPKVCGSPNGPPVTSPRLKLSDGRYLAYKEMGVSKEKAKYRVIITHGYNSSKDLYVPLSQELLDEMGIYIVTFDRAGYAESDPNPKRSVKSEAFDIQELADQLQLGPKFYVVGLSLGAYTTWGCLKYIPNRLAGMALVVPFINPWWPSLPTKLCTEAFRKFLPRDQWGFRVAHYAPRLFWLTQKLLPSTMMMSLEDFMERNPEVYRKCDMEVLSRMSQILMDNGHKVQQQGVYESLYRDVMVLFGKWEFDPTELEDPFPDGEGSVHLWQGYEDGIVSFQLQRYIAQKLPWIKYHEVPGIGHMMFHDDVHCETILRALCKEKNTL
ncbi:uncharacterized protein LOC132270384 isoform X2 [Cornus florida]|uniref:uncharacterized protein LOC132270384 isoform X2 n=1 Tax=Cornus florida TaxID=4283 RepID=UPI0028986C53|nr:uncharacterized protein LOC132270384 isoform X2 [Cornus florida]XP_059627545.1 uncharacterized protein LOC132270384 isoform X2 [Cornus florida]XP_059627546.1 uncharacterized protein LOC132270384 isoform X2 [Cornus florida]XP_059627547.1 uncharacterized protein LOC132270384 isoform X2 [Cornus florida]XP_059627548.1 uncharacterized protein LOC132270384 isoform X2 [Cornus florida]XP_059627549.1 uncharacterized protein LOC132270384 isoform X2 [Cornus florida]XP_059627551.1 uncharacterized prot